MRQIQIFLRFSKVIRQFVWLFPCFVRVANPFVDLKLRLSYITLRIKTKTISHSVFSSQILQNTEINIGVHWKFWRKYGSVSHLFSCTWKYCSHEIKAHSPLKFIYSEKATKFCEIFPLLLAFSECMNFNNHFRKKKSSKNVKIIN